jgi:hypothetical protein
MRWQGALRKIRFAKQHENQKRYMKTYHAWVERNMKKEMDAIIFEEGRNLLQRGSLGSDPYDISDLVGLYQDNLESISALNERVRGLSNVL